MLDFLWNIIFLIGGMVEALYVFCGLIVFRVVLGCAFPKLHEVGFFRRVVIFSAVFLLIGFFVSIAYYGYYWYEYYKYDLNGDGFVDEIEYLRMPADLKNESGSVFLSLWLLVAIWLIPIFVFFVEFVSMIVILFVGWLFEKRHS